MPRNDSTEEMAEISEEILNIDEAESSSVSPVPSPRRSQRIQVSEWQFNDIASKLPAGTLEPFMTSHPQSLQLIQQLLKEEQMEVGDIAPFLERIKNMSDEDVVKAITGGQ